MKGCSGLLNSSVAKWYYELHKIKKSGFLKIDIAEAKMWKNQNISLRSFEIMEFLCIYMEIQFHYRFHYKHLFLKEYNL